MDKFTEQYLITALFAEVDSKGESLDINYSVEDISQESVEKSQEICNQFKKEAGDILSAYSETDVAHDLWLTRKGHGSGFWDGDYEKADGVKLTALAKKMGSPEIYVGDDDKIHIQEN